jgi:hypothetical protein
VGQLVCCGVRKVVAGDYFDAINPLERCTDALTGLEREDDAAGQVALNTSPAP